ncbi:MAG: ABC transporter permease, partial [[Clostridium] leptum]
MWDSVKAAAKNLGRKKLRSSLTILGITIGVASVILIGNIGQCGTQAVNAEVNSLGLGGLTISAGSQEGGEAGLTLEDLKTIRKTASVEEAAPVIMQNTKIGYRNEQMDALVWGIDTKASQVISLQVLYGRSISNGDVNTCANVCMVDQNFARAAYNRDNIVGKHISVLYNGIQENFEVVGVIKTGSGLLSNIIGDYIPNFVYVPYST